MTEVLQVSDFFGSYPSIDKENFNQLIASKEEFSELASLPSEPIPPLGEGFKHQRFAVRFLTHYDRMLFVHQPGTGKSCIITHSAELFKNEYIKDQNDPTKIKRAHIVTSRPLVENIKNEIACKCTDRTYITKNVLNANTAKSRKAAISKELKSWYKIETYGSFAKRVRSMTDEQLDEYMSNTILYIDEVQNLATLRDKKLNPSDDEKESNYDAINRAAHSGSRNKVALFTATPMKNEMRDFIFVINIILSEDDMIENMSENEFSELTFEDLEPYLRGRVSYVRAPYTGAVKQITGTKVRYGDINDEESDLDNIEVIIHSCPMSDFQYNSYLDSLSTNSFYEATRHSSYFVYPDGSYGKKGHDKYVERVKAGKNPSNAVGKYRIKNNDDGYEFIKMLRSDKGARKMSSKLFEAYKICEGAHYNGKGPVPDDKGIVFIFFPDYIKGGASELALLLEERGYTEYRSKESEFSTGQDVKQGPCVSNKTTGSIGIEKKKRFLFLTGETDPSRFNAGFQLLNSYQNRYGEYIQVVIGSEAAGTGISINNAVIMIMMLSSWHDAANEQAYDRVFRATSHVIRILEIMERDNNPNAIFPVKVYNMAATINGDDEFNTEDVKMYFRAQTKDIKISKIMRMIKMASVDCIINRQRNIRPGDEDYSKTCDYEECDYQCAGISDENIPLDSSTKYIYYNRQEVQEAINAIKDIFTDKSTYSINEVYDIIDINSKYIDIAINYIISFNEILLDKFGFTSYLTLGNNNLLYLTRNPYSVDNNASPSYYNNVLINSQDLRTNVMNDYITNINIEGDDEVIDRLKSIKKRTKFEVELTDLSLYNRIKVIEKAILDIKTKGKAKEFNRKVMSFYENNIYTMNEPTDLINKITNIINEKGRTQGRKPEVNTSLIKKVFNTLEFPEFNANISNGSVVFHTLYNASGDNRTIYARKNKYFKSEGLIRVLRLYDNLGWRNATESEYIVYRKYAEETLNTVIKYYDQFNIYGRLVSYTDELIIIDREKGGEGRKCSDIDKATLIDIFYRVKPRIEPSMDYEDIDKGEDRITIKEMNNYINRNISTAKLAKIKLTKGKLKFFYAWASEALSIKDMCKLLYNYFDEYDRLMIEGEILEGERPKIFVGHYSNAPDITYIESDIDIKEEGEVSNIGLFEDTNINPVINDSKMQGEGKLSDVGFAGVVNEEGGVDYVEEGF